jgi:hypothetical protein
LRSAAVQLVYGGTRPAVEHLVTHSRAPARAGMHYFAGLRVPRLQLARAAGDALVALRAGGSRELDGGLFLASASAVRDDARQRSASSMATTLPQNPPGSTAG